MNIRGDYVVMTKEVKMQNFYLVLFCFCLPLVGSASNEVKKHHFVLVHGGCHGAWCWYKMETLLKSGGHRVTSLDMAACGINQKQVQELRSVTDYFEPLVKFMGSISMEDKVILVGHSHGGFGLSMAMEYFPEKILVAVFVTAAMPGPRLSAADVEKEFNRVQGSQMDNQFEYADGPNKPPTAFHFGQKFLAANLYQLSSPEDFTLATKLLRPFPMFRAESKEIILTDEKYGSVSRAFVISDEDRISKYEFQQYLIKNNPPNVVKEIKRSDHMVMLSRSQQLYKCLHEIAGYFS